VALQKKVLLVGGVQGLAGGGGGGSHGIRWAGMAHTYMAVQEHQPARQPRRLLLLVLPA
jgi:hypothetical protein